MDWFFRIWTDTLAVASNFWTAASAITTALAVLVAVVLPQWAAKRERRQRWRGAEVILPALRSEVIEVAEHVERGVRLARGAIADLHKARGLNVAFAQSRQQVLPDTLELNSILMQYKVSGPTSFKLVDCATFELITWNNVRGLASGLRTAHAEELFSAFADVERAKIKLERILRDWPHHANVSTDLLQAYESLMNTIFARLSRLTFYLSEITNKSVPTNFLPRSRVRRTK